MFKVAYILIIVKFRRFKAIILSFLKLQIDRILGKHRIDLTLL